jgi:transcriptional regulator with XRE-family HTH domain
VTLQQLRTALREHRLERHLSFDELAQAIGADKVSAATVRRFIESETEPHETTTYWVERYLDRVHEGVA